MSPQPASLLGIFGATGDLAQRMLLPALLVPGHRVPAVSHGHVLACA